MNWKKLQNGSDIRGVALEGIEGEHVNLRGGGDYRQILRMLDQKDHRHKHTHNHRGNGLPHFR